jgi:hypothetical protein
VGIVARSTLRGDRFGVRGQEAIFLNIVAPTAEIDLGVIRNSGVRVVTHRTIFADGDSMGIFQLKSLLNIGVTTNAERSLFLDQIRALFLEMGQVTDQTVVVVQNRMFLPLSHLLAEILMAPQTERCNLVGKKGRDRRFMAFVAPLARVQAGPRVHFVRRIVVEKRVMATQTDITGRQLHNPSKQRTVRIVTTQTIELGVRLMYSLARF